MLEYTEVAASSLVAATMPTEPRYGRPDACAPDSLARVARRDSDNASRGGGHSSRAAPARLSPRIPGGVPEAQPVVPPRRVLCRRQTVTLLPADGPPTITARLTRVRQRRRDSAPTLTRVVIRSVTRR
jgi:hypothetical protein